MNKWLEAVFGVVPTAFIGWAAKWAAIFENTYFLPYDEPEKVVSSGVAAGTVIVVVAAVAFRSLSARALKRLSLSMLAMTAVLWIACWGIRIRLDYPSTRELAEALANVWQGAALLFIVTVLMAILFAIMASLAGTFKDKGEAQQG